MVYQYVVTLKSSANKYINNFSILLLTISFLLFAREQYFSANVKIPYLFGSIAIAAIIILNMYRQKKDRYYCVL